MSFISRKGKRRPTGPSQDDLGLSGNPGKGDVPRNCFSAQFRNNYDRIDWGAKRQPGAPGEQPNSRHFKKTYGHTHERPIEFIRVAIP